MKKIIEQKKWIKIAVDYFLKRKPGGEMCTCSHIRIPDLWNGKSFAQVRYRNDAISRISIVWIHTNDKIEWSSKFWNSNFSLPV